MEKTQKDVEIIKWLEEHDKNDRADYARINKNIEQMGQEIKSLKTEVKDLKDQVRPMVEQDEHVKWAAQKVTKWLKIAGAVIAVIASAIAIYRGFR